MGAVITAFPSENLVFGTYKNVNKPNSLYGNTAEWNITKDFCLYLIKNGPIRNPFHFKIHMKNKGFNLYFVPYIKINSKCIIEVKM